MSKRGPEQQHSNNELAPIKEVIEIPKTGSYSTFAENRLEAAKKGKTTEANPQEVIDAFIKRAEKDGKLDKNEFVGGALRSQLGSLYYKTMADYSKQIIDSGYPGGVKGLQEVLRKIYPHLEIVADNNFGPATMHALTLFQSEYHLSKGKFGSDTHLILNNKQKVSDIVHGKPLIEVKAPILSPTPAPRVVSVATKPSEAIKQETQRDNNDSWLGKAKKLLDFSSENPVQPIVTVAQNKDNTATDAIKTSIPKEKKEEGWLDKATRLGSDFLDLVGKKGGEVTKEVKEYFYKYAVDMPKEVLEEFLTSIDSDGVKELNRGKAKKLDGVLAKKLGSESISEPQAKTIISKHFSAMEQRVQTENVSGQRKNENIALTPEEKEKREKEKRVMQLYSKLRDNLRTFHKMGPEDLFTKVFIHESGGDKNARTIKLFAASGTGSLGPCQAVSGTYCNDILPETFNPFNPEEALPGAIAFFLLENYDDVHGVAVRKAKEYAKGKPNAKKIIADAEAGKYDVVVALDRYNKGNGGSSSVPLTEMLGEVKDKKYAHGNHADYATLVLKT